MAEVQRADLSIYGNLNTQKPMSLADMLNIGKSSYELSKLQELYPSMISEQQAKSRTAQTAADIAEQTKEPSITKIKSESERAAIEAQKAGVDFNVHQGNLTKSVLGQYATDPDFINGNTAEMVKKLKLSQQYLKEHGVEDKSGLGNQLIQTAKTNPAEVLSLFNNFRKSQMTPTEVQSQIGGQQTVQGQDVSGNPTIMEKSPITGQIVQKPLPIGGGQPANMRIAPTESPTTIATMQEERTIAKDIANTAAPTLSNINTVLKYLPLAQTGKGSEAIAGLQSVFGNLAGSTPEEKAAAARDIIQKNIADLGLQKNAALGGKFVKQLEGAQQSLADAGKNPTAIYKAMQQLKPIIEHTKNYQQGLENTIAKYGSIQVKRLYDNAMIDAFDPVAIGAYDAYKAKNEKDFKEITSGLSEKQKTELGQKMAKYRKLLEGNLE
jgi:hypothetical protein